MSKTTENYLADLAPLILQLAGKAKESLQNNKDAFEQGKLMAFYEILDLMKLQALAFNLELDAVGLKGVDLESLLKD